MSASGPTGRFPGLLCPTVAYPGAPYRKRIPAGSLDAAERALWFGRPARALVLLGAGANPEAGTAAARARWLRGVALLALGRFADAEAVLRAVRPGAAGVPDHFASLALAALASAVRQRQRYREAVRFDRLAYELSGAAAAAKADALVGLTADSVGVGDRETAAGRLAELDGLLAAPARPAPARPAPGGARADRGLAAVSVLDCPAGWRAVVRRHWVACELALFTDRPEAARDAARSAVCAAELMQAPRHIAKSLLFYGVSGREVARRQAVVPLFRSAAVILSRAERFAASLEAFPLLAVAEQQRTETLDEIAGSGENVSQDTLSITAS